MSACIDSMSQFRLAALQVLKSHSWPVAAMLGSPDLDRDGQVKRKRRGGNKALNKELREYGIQDHLWPTESVHKGSDVISPSHSTVSTSAQFANRERAGVTVLVPEVPSPQLKNQSPLPLGNMAPRCTSHTCARPQATGWSLSSHPRGAQACKGNSWELPSLCPVGISSTQGNQTTGSFHLQAVEGKGNTGRWEKEKEDTLALAVGKIMASKDVLVPTPRTWECCFTWQKGLGWSD